MSNAKGHLGARARVKSADWGAIRAAFIDRPERPLYEDLATEFSVSAVRIARASADEGWPALRAARLDAALRSSDAVKALLDAAANEGTLQRTVTNVALEVLGQLQLVAQEAGKATGKAENTRANTLNTVAFALRNLTGALKDAGIVGLPRALKSAAGMSDEQGRWNPAMLQSLNVTVQNLVSTVAPQAPSVAILEGSAAADEAEAPRALAEPAGAALDVPPAPEREPVLAGCSVTTVTEPAAASGGHPPPDAASIV